MDGEDGNETGPLKELHERDAQLWDALQEESAETGSTLLCLAEGMRHETADRESAASRIYERLSYRADHLQEQVDELSGAVLDSASGIYDLQKWQNEEEVTQKARDELRKLKREFTEVRAYM